MHTNVHSRHSGGGEQQQAAAANSTLGCDATVHRAEKSFFSALKQIQCNRPSLNIIRPYVTVMTDLSIGSRRFHSSIKTK